MSHTYNSLTTPGTITPDTTIGTGGTLPTTGGTNPLASATDAVLSGNGKYVAFASPATDLVQGQNTGGRTNVFLYTVATGKVTLISGAGGSSTVGGDGNSDSPSISDDGTYVAYRSDADNLVSGQIAGSNIYEYNTQLRTEVLVSHEAGFPSVAAGGASEPVTDNDGHLVAYVSTAGDLVSGQSGPAGVANVFVWLRPTGANDLVSGEGGSASVTGDGDSDHPLLAGLGFPAFSSVATDLVGGAAGTSVGYINTRVAVALSPNAVAEGSPPGTLVGSLSVTSLGTGQYLAPRYSLSANDSPANAFFTVGGAGTAALFTAADLGPAPRGYAVGLRVDAGFGNNLVTLPVLVTSQPPAPPLAGATDVTPETPVTSGPVRHQGSHLRQVVTLRYLGGVPLTGLVTVVVVGLGRKVRLLNRMGVTAEGFPYLLLPADLLTAGARLQLVFSSASGRLPHYSVLVLAGPG